MLVFAVALSIAGLAIGPGLVALGRGRAVPSAAIEGLTLGVVPALVVLRLLPHLYATIGAWALAATALGYVALWLADRWGHRAGARIGQAVIVPAIALHALTDGAGLAVAAAAVAHGSSSGLLLGAVLLLHRLPEGLFLTTTLVPIVGWRQTLWRLGVVAAATIVGAALGSALLSNVPDALFDVVVAIGLGAMLRLALHTHAPAPTERLPRLASSLGFAGGIVLALAAPSPGSVLRFAQPSELSIVQSLGPLFLETAPAFLAALVLAGVLHAVFPPRTAAWLREGPSWQRAFRGLAFGVARPSCMCGVLPMGRRMFSDGVPPVAVVAFMVGSPLLGLEGAFLTDRLLGIRLMIWLVAGAIAVTMAVSISTRTVARVAKKHRVALPVVAVGTDDAPRTIGGRMLAGLRDAAGETIDQSGAWYLAGLVLASAFEAGSRSHFATRLGAPSDLIAVALLAMPLAVASHGAVPLAAVMVHKGFSPGAAVALLLSGPAVSLAMASTVRRALGLRAAVVLVASVVVLAAMIGILVNVTIPSDAVPAMHRIVTHVHPWWEWGSAAALLALLGASLLRVGPREWFGNMALGGDEAAPGEHDHGVAHDHDHPPSEEPPYPAAIRESKR